MSSKVYNFVIPVTAQMSYIALYMYLDCRLIYFQRFLTCWRWDGVFFLCFFLSFYFMRFYFSYFFLSYYNNVAAAAARKHNITGKFYFYWNKSIDVVYAPKFMKIVSVSCSHSHRQRVDHWISIINIILKLVKNRVDWNWSVDL